MEGVRRIVLIQPVPTGEFDAAGQRLEREQEYPVWAERFDRPSAAEGMVMGGVEGGNWQRRYVFRAEALPANVIPTEDWRVLDETNTGLDIVNVAETTRGARSRRLVIVCERRNLAHVP